MSEPYWVPLGAVSAVGDELAYAEFTGTVSTTATTEAAAVTVATSPAVTVDGLTPIIVEFFSPYVVLPPTLSAGLFIYLYQDGVSIGLLGYFQSPAAASLDTPLNLRRRLTPAAGSHVYSIRASVNAGTGSVAAGIGGSGQWSPGFIRVSTVRPTGVGAGGAYVSPELAYAEFSANVSVPVSAPSAAVTVVSSGAVTYDGSPVTIWFYCPAGVPGWSSVLYITLWDGSTDLGILAQQVNPSGSANLNTPVQVSRKLTPTAGSHTFIAKAYATGGTSLVHAGSGGSGVFLPGHIKVVRA